MKSCSKHPRQVSRIPVANGSLTKLQELLSNCRPNHIMASEGQNFKSFPNITREKSPAVTKNSSGPNEKSLVSQIQEEEQNGWLSHMLPWQGLVLFLGATSIANYLPNWVSGKECQQINAVAADNDIPDCAGNVILPANSSMAITSTKKMEAPVEATEDAASSKDLSIASYTALIQAQGGAPYFRKRSRARANKRSRSRRRGHKLSMANFPEPIEPIMTQPIGGLDVAVASYIFPSAEDCQGLERFNKIQEVFIQPSPGFFSFLSSSCPSFLLASRYDIFSQETLSPMFTITQTCNRWSKYFENSEQLNYLVNHNDYSDRWLRRDLCLLVQCHEFFERSLLHNGRFLLAETGVELGSCEYESTNQRNPVLRVNSYLTRETFTVRSFNYAPGFQDSDFVILNDHKEAQHDGIFEGQIIGQISRRIPKIVRLPLAPDQKLFPKQERVIISFAGKVHPYTKGTIIATALVIKHDLFK